MQQFSRILFIMFICWGMGSASSALAQLIPSQSDTEELDKFSNAIETLATLTSPAVVQIFSSGYVPAAGLTSSTSSLVSKERTGGSGVLVSSDGYIITNAHVVSGASRVQILLASTIHDSIKRKSILKPAGKMVGAQVVGIDQETDLAVLKIVGNNLPFLRLGDSDKLRKGQIVLALGSPLGLQNSVTLGVVSSVARQRHLDDPMVYIQTDATINPGNSGGPLINALGEVVGINTFILSQSGGSEGIGFAAPSNIVRNVFSQIRENGFVRRGEIGVNAQTITPLLAEGLGLSQNWGAILGDVYPGSPADRAGLKVGDIILTLDGKVMENGRQFGVNLYSRGVDSEVELVIRRGSETLTKRVKVIERRDDPGRFATMVSPDRNVIPRLGILALELNQEVLRMLPPLRKKAGVVVAGRSTDASFGDGGLLPGDVIYAVNGQTVRDLAGLRDLIDNLQIGKGAAIQIERGSQLRYVVIEIEN